METRIVVPSLGESVIEATVLRWLKQPGQPVKAGEPMVELETDKINVEVNAERNGVLVSVEHKEGEDVRVGDVLGVIGETAPEGATPSDGHGTSNEEKSAQQPTKPQQPSRQEVPSAPAPEINEPEQPSVPERIETKQSVKQEEKVTPVARRFAEENNIDLTRVQGSGPQGRITRHDLETLAIKEPREEQSPAVTRQPEAPAAQPGPQPVARPSQDGREERVRMSRRRRTIAQNLLQAQQNAALLTTFNDVDMDAVMRIRKARKEAFKAKIGASLGIVSFFVKASILALKDFPMLNAEIQGDEIVLKHYYDIGVAIGAEEGLVVPVLRDADQMTFGQIEHAIAAYAQKVKMGTLSLADLQGGTFTITNGGVFGSLLSTPIVNAPQVGILGLHRIEERPVARDGSVVIRPMMYLALTYDHRIVDGREAVQFLVRIKEAIENPEIMLLDL